MLGAIGILDPLKGQVANLVTQTFAVKLDSTPPRAACLDEFLRPGGLMTDQQVSAETKEKLLNALRILVASRDVSARLDLAIPGLNTLKETDFPHDLRNDYKKLRAMLDQRGQKISGGRIDVQDAAFKILELYRRIMEES